MHEHMKPNGAGTWQLMQDAVDAALCVLQVPQLGVCLNKVPLFDRNIMVTQLKRK